MPTPTSPSHPIQSNGAVQLTTHSLKKRKGRLYGPNFISRQSSLFVQSPFEFWILHPPIQKVWITILHHFQVQPLSFQTKYRTNPHILLLNSVIKWDSNQTKRFLCSMWIWIHGPFTFDLSSPIKIQGGSAFHLLAKINNSYAISNASVFCLYCKFQMYDVSVWQMHCQPARSINV